MGLSKVGDWGVCHLCCSAERGPKATFPPRSPAWPVSATLRRCDAATLPRLSLSLIFSFSSPTVVYLSISSACQQRGVGGITRPDQSPLIRSLFAP